MRRRGEAPARPSSRIGQRFRSDNITLIPASQLPFREHWEQIAQGLPAREALLVVPAEETRLKQVARALAPQLRAKGRHVTTVGAERLG